MSYQIHKLNPQGMLTHLTPRTSSSLSWTTALELRLSGHLASGRLMVKASFTGRFFMLGTGLHEQIDLLGSSLRGACSSNPCKARPCSCSPPAGGGWQGSLATCRSCPPCGPFGTSTDPATLQMHSLTRWPPFAGTLVVDLLWPAQASQPDLPGASAFDIREAILPR